MKRRILMFSVLGVCLFGCSIQKTEGEIQTLESKLIESTDVVIEETTEEIFVETVEEIESIKSTLSEQSMAVGEIRNIVYDEDENNEYSLDFQRFEVNNYGITSLDVPAVFTRSGEEPLKVPGIEKPNYYEIDPNTLVDNSEAYYYDGAETIEHFSRYVYDVGQFQMWKSIPFELEEDVVDWDSFKRYSCGSELYKAGGLVVKDSFEQTITKQGYPAAVCIVMLPDVYDPNPDPKQVIYIESTIYAWYADGCLNYGLIGLKKPVQGDLGKYMFIESIEDGK